MPALWIIAEGTGRAWQVWPEAEPLPAGAIQEGGQYLIELRNIADPLAADLFLDDLPVDALRPPGPDIARWRWSPGFHAGSLEVRLELGQGRRHRFPIVTDPDLRKMTRAAFDTMVAEILRDTFALFSMSSFRTGIAKGTGHRPPPIARLEYLRSRLAELVRTVETIAGAPQRALRAEEIALPYWRASTATGPEILRSFRSGTILREKGHPSRLPAGLKGHLPARIRQSRRSSTWDTREHRDIKASLTAWAGWLARAGDLLGLAPAEDIETRRLQALWAGRIRGMARRLAGLLALPFFAGVSDRPGHVLLTSVYRNVPAYRTFFRLHREFSLGIAGVFGDFLQMPLARTFELYELWCFLRLLRSAVRRHGADPGALSALFDDGTARGTVILSRGPVTVPLASGIALSFQLTFREVWLEASGRGSYSRSIRPDLVLSGPPEGGWPLIILDAKYRIDTALNDALASIHMYRDALVEDDHGGQIRDIVRAAYLLSPHLPFLPDEWRDAGLPGRLFHPGYRAAFRFGALTLRPGMPDAEVDAALDALVADATA